MLVISAVEGVQPQTRVLLRALRRRGIPFLFFVNKIDRRGADFAAVQAEIERRLGVPTLAMGRVEREGTRDVEVVQADTGRRWFRDSLIEVMAGMDDRLLDAYVEDEIGPDAEVWRARADQPDPAVRDLSALPRLGPDRSRDFRAHRGHRRVLAAGERRSGRTGRRPGVQD